MTSTWKQTISARAANCFLAALLVVAAGARAAEGWPALITPVEPSADTFYTSPGTAELRSVVPGTVLRYREMTAKAYAKFPIRGKAWQVMYRSTDHKGQAVANITAILVPWNAPRRGRKAFAYNIAYDARTLKCAPSYQLANGTTWELPWIDAGLRRGWVAIVPDYEGLESFWAIGKYVGPAVLDAIRAAESFGPAGLSGASTPVGIMGYSGGAIASRRIASARADRARPRSSTTEYSTR